MVMGSFYSDLQVVSKDTLTITYKFFANLSVTRKLLDKDFETLHNFFKDFQYLYKTVQQQDYKIRKLTEDLKISEQTVKMLQIDC